MKKVIFLLALLLGIAPAQAGEISRVTSQRGVTQAQWEATDLYKSFTCPEGTGRGIGVDMNFTTDQSDDTWFATCNTIEVIAPRPIIDTPTVTVPVVTPIVETITVTPVAAVETITAQVVQSVQPTTNQSSSINATVSTAPTPTPVVETTTSVLKVDTPTVVALKTVQLSNVIWALKNQIKEIKKLNAKVLVRTKKK